VRPDGHRRRPGTSDGSHPGSSPRVGRVRSCRSAGQRRGLSLPRPPPEVGLAGRGRLGCHRFGHPQATRPAPVAHVALVVEAGHPTLLALRTSPVEVDDRVVAGRPGRRQLVQTALGRPDQPPRDPGVAVVPLHQTPTDEVTEQGIESLDGVLTSFLHLGTSSYWFADSQYAARRGLRAVGNAPNSVVATDTRSDLRRAQPVRPVGATAPNDSAARRWLLCRAARNVSTAPASRGLA